MCYDVVVFYLEEVGQVCSMLRSLIGISYFAMFCVCVLSSCGFEPRRKINCRKLLR